MSLKDRLFRDRPVVRRPLPIWQPQAAAARIQGVTAPPPENPGYSADGGPTAEMPPAYIPGGDSLPRVRPVVTKSTFMEDFRKIVADHVRIKPSYADCWLIGSVGELETIAEYATPNGRVVIGTVADGETEYNLTPSEYTNSDALNAVIERAIAAVRDDFRRHGGRTDRPSVTAVARDCIMRTADSVMLAAGGDPAAFEQLLDCMCDTVYRYTVGLGVFDLLLADPKLEDIYIDAPCDRNRIHVTMSGVGGLNSHVRCRTNLVVDRREVMNLINVLKRESGLPFCESNPILETDMPRQDSRATVVGYPMSPNGDAVAIRKHSNNPWTLTRLIANGTIDAMTAGLLSFLVDNRCTFLICGARGSGKSSLLSALLFEFPVSQRILTIEDTIELPGEKMRRMGYKVQSMLVDERIEGSSLSRSDEALRVSLRMGESAIILGEVRGVEAKTLYQSMRTGRAGSSIMGTIHGDSARSVFERVVHDMGIAPEAFMATDVLVTIGTFRDRVTGAQVRKISEVVVTADRAGEFLPISGTDPAFASPVMRRVLSSSMMTENEIRTDIQIRAQLKAFLAVMGTRYGEEYYGPEWGAAVNEHLAKAMGRSAEEVLRSFRAKFHQQTGLDTEVSG
ncbi:MAG: type II/IV secretion system ATPase subunit [Methanomethylophilus sp.]|nr:type II/IV secretion system ATPase subunit [Methanomethylophilus sp.]MDD4669145.1 type II/IV secretion system ATPase subunit [Methanomethylophilus sp.]